MSINKIFKISCHRNEYYFKVTPYFPKYFANEFNHDITFAPNINIEYYNYGKIAFDELE